MIRRLFFVEEEESNTSKRIKFKTVKVGPPPPDSADVKVLDLTSP